MYLPDHNFSLLTINFYLPVRACAVRQDNLAIRRINLACVANLAHACVNLADENQRFSSIPPPVKKSDSLICQDIVLTFVESALNHIGIIHIHNAVSYTHLTLPTIA